MTGPGAEAVLGYHEATKHSEWSVRTSSHSLDWENEPLPYKVYPDLAPLPLPSDFAARDVPALAAVAASPAPRAGTDRTTLDLSSLARVLFLAAGVVKRVRYPRGVMHFRAYPNTGALYHIDAYLVTADLPDLPAGVYHFAPHDFALRRLRSGDWRGLLVEASGGSPDLARARAIVAIASTWWRNSWKYQERAWRHCFWDGGTLLANLLAAAETASLAPRLVLGFADAPVERLLGLDPAREGAIALCALGRGAPTSGTAARPPPILHLATEPLSREEVDYPAIRAAQSASCLPDGAAAAAWRGPAPERIEAEAAGAVVALRPQAGADRSADSLDAVVRRRGSTRAFDRARGLSFGELSTLLDAATRGVPADFLAPPGASLLDLYLIVHAVEGLAPGAYYYRRGARALELLREGSFRGAAGRLGLGQQLPADAAVDVYCLADLPRVLDRFGGRGYRAAQLEGGITGGRLYLAAYAQRFGATGLTFFDDEVTEFFSPHASGKSVMFLTALGRPDRAALASRSRS